MVYNLPTLIQLNHNITPPNKLSTNIQLRNSWPLRIQFHTLSYTLIGQYIHRHEINIVRIQYLTGSVGKATLGEEFGALHEEED